MCTMVYCGSTSKNVAKLTVLILASILHEASSWMKCEDRDPSFQNRHGIFSTNTLLAFPRCKNAWNIVGETGEECYVLNCTKYEPASQTQFCEQYQTFKDRRRRGVGYPGDGHDAGLIAMNLLIPDVGIHGWECTLFDADVREDRLSYIRGHCQSGFVHEQYGKEWNFPTYKKCKNVHTVAMQYTRGELLDAVSPFSSFR